VARILCDTGILLRLVDRLDPIHDEIWEAVTLLLDGGHELLYTPHNLREYWNVATRPGDQNGLGLTIKQNFLR
jgi:predicted nucleic acid-binding protein